MPCGNGIGNGYMQKIFFVGLNFSNSEKGFTLPEIMVALAVTSIVMLLVGTIFVTGINSNKMLEAVITRDGLQRDILRALRSNRAIGHTCAGNPLFRTCFTRGGGSCDANIENEFILFDSSGEQIGGTTALPIFFDRNGRRVLATDSTREFQVTTTFRAQGYPVDFADNNYQFLLEDKPIGSRLHELLLIGYRIRHLEGQTPTPLAPREGGYTISLDLKYRDSGCPTP